MNILIFSHTSILGGAENALISLVKELAPSNKITIIFPNLRGALVDFFRKMNIHCVELPIGFFLPTPANALLEFSKLNTDHITNYLKGCGFDLVINNTIVTLHGMLLAKELNIPSILYAHEKLEFDPDLSPHGCSTPYYLNLVAQLSNHILCASEYVKKSFEEEKNKVSVLYPFTPYEPINFTESEENRNLISILVIGNKTLRKNAHFSITVLKALRLRGVNAELHIIGTDFAGAHKLQQKLSLRSEPNVHVLPNQAEPYQIGNGKKITLITALSEPFGLTVTESLFRGIPVVSSKCGGPEEILTEDYLYETNNLDRCVRAIENIASNYDDHSQNAEELYSKFIEKNSKEIRSLALSNAINSAIQDFKSKKESHFKFDWVNFKNIHALPLRRASIEKNIAAVSAETSERMDIKNVSELVAKEKISPGISVMNDIRHFDVVPFAMSDNLNELYKNGLGLAIELVANLEDQGKLAMLSFILLAITEKISSQPDCKILCLGDGLGIDSIKLALCGLEVDYIDVDSSLMSRCAELNIKDIKISNNEIKLDFIKNTAQKYDAVISLEVIEHVDEPLEFLKYIHDLLSPNGLLFISECFDGIYDRWGTHLLKNEELTSMLPIIANPLFKLIDINGNPYGKPYMFKKRNIGEDTMGVVEYLNDRNYLIALINSRTKIGI